MMLVCFSMVACLTQAVDLSFAPKNDSYVVRKVRVEHGLALRELSTIRAGNVQSSTESVEIRAVQELLCTDRYLEVAQGRVARLQRRFDIAQWQGDLVLPTGADRLTAKSPMSGLSVLFTFVPAEQDYGRYYDAREGVEEHLHGISQDLDLLCLLPRQPASIGSRWEVDLPALVDVFAPGGRWALAFQLKPAQRNLVRSIQNGIGCNLVEVFGGESKGRTQAHLVGVEGELAKIELDFELSNRVDRRALVQMQMNGQELASGYRCQSAPLTWVFTGKGTLLWDLARHRAHELKIQGRERVGFDTELKIGNDPTSTTQRLSMEGSLVLEWILGEPRDPRLKAAMPAQGQK